DRLEEALAVLVDLLDGERGDREAELTEDDLAGHVVDLRRGEPEETLGRVVHDRRIDADAHRERARHVDADVLQRERVAKIDVDGERGEAQVLVALDERPDERAAAVDAARALPLAHLTVDD